MHIKNKIRQNMLPRKRYAHLDYRTLSATLCPENDSPGTPGIDLMWFFFPWGNWIVFFNGFLVKKN
jgi:hypothetical protein